MKKLKNLIALLVAISMLVTIAGCGNNSTGRETNAEVSEEEDKYSEHIEFDATFFYSLWNASAGYDLESDPYIQYVLDKFNVTVDILDCAYNTADETSRLWVNGGTMPDTMIWENISRSEMAEYADQGLLKALPDGWEDRWPNLKRMFDATGSADIVTVDGKVYGIPHAVYGNFLAVETMVDNAVVYYRTDFAKQVGMDDMGSDGSVSLEELKEYLTKVGDAGLCENPTLLCDPGSLLGFFQKAYGISGNEFVSTDDGYIWGVQQENYVEMIKEMQEWYNAGLIDPDYYVKETAKAEYREGFSAASVFAGNTGTYTKEVVDPLMDAAGEKLSDETLRAKYWDMFAMAAIEGNDGNVYSSEIRNYWLISSFNPDTDDATVERILDMMDWFCSYEGQASVTCGIPGEDFTIDENNKITILNEDIISGEYQVHPSSYFAVWGYCGDDMQYSAGLPGKYEFEIDLSRKTYEAKWNGKIIPMDPAFDNLVSEAKDNYSVNTGSIVHEIVTQNKDVKSSMEEYIKTNENLWKPVVDDLNTVK